MTEEILVPLDGSPFGEAALGPALEIAERGGGRLHLVSACDPDMAGPALLESELSYEAAFLQYLEGVREEVLRGRQVAIEVRVVTGSVVDALVEEAERSGVELTVLSTHGHGPLSRLWMGSVADRFVRRTPSPVLLVRPEEGRGEGGELAQPAEGADRPRVDPLGGLDHVLVPLDGSPVGDAVLEHAADLARLFDSEVTLFGVVWLPRQINPEHLPHVEWVDRGHLLEDRAAAVRTRLEVVRDRLREREVDARVAVEEEAHPADAILEFAETRDVDLIALGTHGRGGVARALLGSVADKVVRGARCPVLLVRGDD